jgi:hypothetical protein
MQAAAVPESNPSPATMSPWPTLRRNIRRNRRGGFLTTLIVALIVIAILVWLYFEVFSPGAAIGGGFHWLFGK